MEMMWRNSKSSTNLLRNCTDKATIKNSENRFTILSNNYTMGMYSKDEKWYFEEIATFKFIDTSMFR